MKTLDNIQIGQELSLLELSNFLIEEERYKFKDIFDFSIEIDVLELDEKIGSFADIEGDIVVQFDILKIGDDEGSCGLTHLDTIVKITKID